MEQLIDKETHSKPDMKNQNNNNEQKKQKSQQLSKRNIIKKSIF